MNETEACLQAQGDWNMPFPFALCMVTPSSHRLTTFQTCAIQLDRIYRDVPDSIAMD